MLIAVHFEYTLFEQYVILDIVIVNYRPQYIVIATTVSAVPPLEVLTLPCTCLLFAVLSELACSRQ